MKKWEIIILSLITGIIILLSVFLSSFIEVLWLYFFSNLDNYMFHAIIGLMIFLVVVFLAEGFIGFFNYRFLIIIFLISDIFYVFHGLEGLKLFCILIVLFVIIDDFYKYKISRFFNFVLFLIYLKSYKLFR
jgi:hypothetical protein